MVQALHQPNQALPVVRLKLVNAAVVQVRILVRYDFDSVVRRWLCSLSISTYAIEKHTAC